MKSHEAMAQGGIYPLVAMLKSKSKDVQRNSAKVLAHLATEQPIRISIVDEGAITPLLDLLVDPVAENSMAACKALLNIAVCACLPFNIRIISVLFPFCFHFISFFVSCRPHTLADTSKLAAR